LADRPVCDRMTPDDGYTELQHPFVAYARCAVTYDGRASSQLRVGNYLLVHKSDGSFLVHGSDLCTPLNYQPARSRLYRTPSGLVCRSKKERMVVTVEEYYFERQLAGWSDHKIAIVRTERELQAKLERELPALLPEYEITAVHREFATELGPVDLVAVDSRGWHHVVEVKRAQATVAAGVQLRKYVEVLAERGHTVRGYVAAPTIAPNALAYLTKRGFRYLAVSHSGVDPGPIAEMLGQQPHGQFGDAEVEDGDGPLLLSNPAAGPIQDVGGETPPGP